MQAASIFDTASSDSYRYQGQGDCIQTSAAQPKRPPASQIGHLGTSRSTDNLGNFDPEHPIHCQG